MGVPSISAAVPFLPLPKLPCTHKGAKLSGLSIINCESVNCDYLINQARLISKCTQIFLPILIILNSQQLQRYQDKEHLYSCIRYTTLFMTLLHITNIKDQAISPLSLSPSKRLRMKRPTPCFGVKWPQMNLLWQHLLEKSQHIRGLQILESVSKIMRDLARKMGKHCFAHLTSLSARFMCLISLKHIETME